MRIGSQSATNSQSIEPGLLLIYAPGFGCACLHFFESSLQINPPGTTFNGDKSGIAIQFQDFVQPRAIEQHAVGQELLSASSMPAAANGQRLPSLLGNNDCPSSRCSRCNGKNCAHPGGIQCRVYVVYKNFVRQVLLGQHRLPWRQTRNCSHSQEVASVESQVVDKGSHL